MKSSQNYFQTALSNCFPFFVIILMLSFFYNPINANSINGKYWETLSGKMELNALFSVANNGHVLGETTIFVNQSTGANSFVWDFGDGNFSNDESPTHVYEAAGRYTVRLIVTGAGGTSEFIGEIEVVLL